MPLTITQQAKQRVEVIQQPKLSVEIYHKGDPGDSAYEIAVENGFVGTEAEWLTSLSFAGTFNSWVASMFTEGEKITAVDAGLLRQESITDDYIYKCVQAGTAESTPGAKDGTAIWKKYLLFQSR